MTESPTGAGPRAQLFLFDRPRIEIPLSPGALPAWLVVALPGPTSGHRPQGRFLADPRIPESEVEFAWGEVPALPKPRVVLTVSVGGQSWTLEQDAHDPGRWLRQAHADRRRHWS